MATHPHVRPGDTSTEDEPLSVEWTRVRPHVAVVRAVGEIDLLTAPAWARALLDAAADVVGPPALVLPVEDTPAPPVPAPTPALVGDLCGVTFLGAAGLAVIAETAARAEAEGVAIRWFVDTRAVRRALRLSGLDRTLDLRDPPVG